MVKTTKKENTNIIIASENSPIRELVASILRSPDVVCTESSSGFQALHLLEQQEYGIAIFDQYLPDMSALELIALTRIAYPNLPIIIFTSIKKGNQGQTREFYQAAMAEGANDYVITFNPPKELLDKVKKLLG